jgi:hypothetical protein
VLCWLRRHLAGEHREVKPHASALGLRETATVSELCHMPPRPRSNTVVYGDTRMHINDAGVVDRDVRWWHLVCVSTRETKIIAHAAASDHFLGSCLPVTGFGAHDTDVRANCVRPLNVPRSLRRFTRAASELCHILPSNPGQHRGLRETRFISLLREVLDRECVGAIWCASARAEGINFQACSFNHSDISPLLESTICGGRKECIVKRSFRFAPFRRNGLHSASNGE